MFSTDHSKYHFTNKLAATIYAKTYNTMTNGIKPRDKTREKIELITKTQLEVINAFQIAAHLTTETLNYLIARGIISSKCPNHSPEEVEYAKHTIEIFEGPEPAEDNYAAPLGEIFELPESDIDKLKRLIAVDESGMSDKELQDHTDKLLDQINRVIAPNGRPIRGFGNHGI